MITSFPPAPALQRSPMQFGKVTDGDDYMPALDSRGRFMGDPLMVSHWKALAEDPQIQKAAGYIPSIDTYGVETDTVAARGVMHRLLKALKPGQVKITEAKDLSHVAPPFGGGVFAKGIVQGKPVRVVLSDKGKHRPDHLVLTILGLGKGKDQLDMITLPGGKRQVAFKPENGSAVVVSDADKWGARLFQRRALPLLNTVLQGLVAQSN